MTPIQAAQEQARRDRLIARRRRNGTLLVCAECGEQFEVHVTADDGTSAVLGLYLHTFGLHQRPPSVLERTPISPRQLPPEPEPAA